MTKRILTLLALLLGLLLVLCGCSGEEAKTKSGEEIKLYWNVERELYYDETTKTTFRGKAGDTYRVRFAIDGEQVDLFVKDSITMDLIDSYKFMGLSVDKDNVITGVYKPYEFTGGVAAYEYYVISIEGEQVICNNISNGRGLPLKLKINENTGIYDVADNGLLAGIPCDLQPGDQIYAIMGLDGYVSHIFVMPPFEPKPVYWNANRQYDSNSKISTRTRDASGYYVIDFIVDGQPVTFKALEMSVADQIDSFGARCMHLEFDEEGIIIAAKHARYATGGNSAASWYHVKRLDKVGESDDINLVADGFYAEKLSGSDKGKTATLSYANNCKIYDMSGTGAYLGQTTELRLGDQIHCLTDPNGDVCIIFVVNRPRNLELYYNMERKYDTTKKESTRTMSADSFYHFEMSVNGKTVSLKTQDPAVVKTIDARGAKVLGLELDGNIITAAYAPSSVEGANRTIFDYANVTEIAADGTVTAERNGETYTGMLSSGCEIYNVSNMATTKGEVTKLQVGDRVYGLGDMHGNINHIYVVGRYLNSKVYWNLDREFDSKTKTSERKPSADGYYYIKLAVGTETKTYKTKNKALVDKLDSYVAVALQASGDVITAVYKYDCALGYTGGGFGSWMTVKSISGSTIVAANDTTSNTGNMIAGCPVYNVSAGSSVPVRTTKLQVGDKIHGIKNSDGQIVVVYVVGRTLDLDLYYNIERKWDEDRSVTTRVPDANGWYWFDMVVNSKHVKLKTKNLTVVNAIDERSAKVLGLELKGDEILAAYKPSSVKSSAKTVFDFAVVKSISGNTITATKGDKTVTGTVAKNAKIYNVSDAATKIGEPGTIKVGDTIYGLGSDAKVANHVFITKRTMNLDLYYNIDRKWDKENSITTRVPDAEGWYWFSMTTNTKQVQLKTKSLEIANTIDERAAKVLGLQLKGDEILAAYKPSSVMGATSTVFDFAVVKSISGNTITATKGDKTVTGTLSGSVKIFNVSEAADTIGEYTTVQVGDTIYGLGTGKNAVNFVFVSKREVKPTTKTALCTACNETVTWNSWNGKTSLEDGHWYLNRNATLEKTATIVKDANVCLDLCGYLLSGKDTVDRMFNIYGVLNIMDSGENGKVISTYANDEGRTGTVFYVQNSKDNGAGTMNLYGGTLTSTGNTKQGGVGGVSYQFNMYGGTIIGGKAVKGGNLYLEGAATVKIYGGSIVGGAADQGADIYTKRNVTVGGNAVIGNIYLESGKTIAIDGLTEGASIGVTLADTYGTVATNAAEADLERFVVAEDLKLKFADGKLVIAEDVVVEPVEHDDHCICGGLGNIGDHACTETNPVWEPWTGSWESGKYYYLTNDYTLSKTITVKEGESLYLCLNGFDINGASNVTRMFNCYGALTICDHADENGNFSGDVISNYEGDNTQTGRVFYVQSKNGAAFNLFGGNLRSNSITNKGGIGGGAKIINIYGGTISGGKASVSGGNLQIDGGVTTIYTNITGGQSPLGGDIYLSAGQLILSGKANIGDIYLTSNRTVKIQDLDQSASIGITLADTYGDFATNATEADLDRFVVAEGLTKVYADGKLSIVENQDPEQPEDPEEPEDPDAHKHCICGGLGNIGDHTCTENAPVWEPWTGTWESGKYYYLTEDYPLNATITVQEGKHLNLCLNGHDILGAASVNRIFNVFGVLNICDHKAENGTYAGDVINNYDISLGDIKTGGVFYVQNRTEAAFNLYGGNLTFTTKLKNGGIGGITATFRMYDGKLNGNTVSGDGGVLYLEHAKANVRLYGGEIGGGRAANGGNIYLKNGSVYVDGATISGGYATNAGGSIRVQADTNLYLISGKITGGEAKGNGGNIYSLGNVSITGGSLEKGKAPSGKIGGNLYASGGSLQIADDPNVEGAPSVTGGSGGNGGNIAIKIDNVEISGCTISGGTADKGGDIYFEKSGGTLTIADCGAVSVYVAAGTVTGDENVTVTP